MTTTRELFIDLTSDAAVFVIVQCGRRVSVMYPREDIKNPIITRVIGRLLTKRLKNALQEPDIFHKL